MAVSEEKIFRTPSSRPLFMPRIGWKEMRARLSQRRYLPDPLSEKEREALEKIIEQFNRKSGLQISLVCGKNDVFQGHISSARNYLVLAGLAGDPNLEEKCGYFGEMAVLCATSMGLSTCWVGGTYDRSACMNRLNKGVRLVCVIAIGHGAGNTSTHSPHRSTKSPRELSNGLAEAPEWFSEALTAVQLAPSAMNCQDVCFDWNADGSVTGSVTDSESFSMVDLGIAKLHFELGAHGGDWEWGSGGVFRRAVQEKSCGAVIHRERDGAREYLIIRHNGGHWSFPKGHVENNETEVETAAREIREETGLIVDIITDFRSVVTYSPKNGVVKDVVFFLASVTGGVEHAQEEEIAQLEWFPFETAREVVTFPTDIGVLVEAEEFLAKKD